MDPKPGRSSTQGATGEIVIRGENVTTGYESNDPRPMRTAFADGWFRTGDLGVFDDEGYLSIAGRHEGDHQSRRREDQPA